VVKSESTPVLDPELASAARNELVQKCPSAVIAGFSGWLLDAFDFFLVTFCLTAIAKDFHKTDSQIALVITTTLVFRPVGGFIFGLIADRYGRRLPLMINIAVFAVAEVLTGLSPNYTSLLVIRALFGVIMGGNWGVGASLAMEGAPVGKRGVLSGLFQEGYAAGNVLAAGCYFFLGRLGWRPLFLLELFPRFYCSFSYVSELRSQPSGRGSPGDSKLGVNKVEKRSRIGSSFFISSLL